MSASARQVVIVFLVMVVLGLVVGLGWIITHAPTATPATPTAPDCEIYGFLGNSWIFDKDGEYMEVGAVVDVGEERYVVAFSNRGQIIRVHAIERGGEWDKDAPYLAHPYLDNHLAVLERASNGLARVVSRKTGAVSLVNLCDPAALQDPGLRGR